MIAIRLVFSAFAAAGVLLRGGAGQSRRDPKQAGQDSKAIQSCIKSVKGAATNAERCIGMIADPCLKRPGALSNADMVACASREVVGLGRYPQRDVPQARRQARRRAEGQAARHAARLDRLARPHLRLL